MGYGNQNSRDRRHFPEIAALQPLHGEVGGTAAGQSMPGGTPHIQEGLLITGPVTLSSAWRQASQSRAYVATRGAPWVRPRNAATFTEPHR